MNANHLKKQSAKDKKRPGLLLPSAQPHSPRFFHYQSSRLAAAFQCMLLKTVLNSYLLMQGTGTLRS
jgi:hypothetical protein